MAGRPRVAMVFRGDRAMRGATVLEGSRLGPIAAALADVGIAAEAAVYGDAFADEVREQLLDVHGVLVWVDPVSGGEDRTVLDAILREVADAGVWVSAHPDVILRMGTKEVLYSTRRLGWGTDTDLYRSPAELRASLPARLATGEARVLKQYRGNGGIGVWKVQLAEPPRSGDVTDDMVVRVQSAHARDDHVDELSLAEFMARSEKYFGFADGDGRLIDQPFQPTISEGLVRCYLVKAEVVGFCRQYPDAELPPERVFGLPGAKTMFGRDEPDLRDLRERVETEWLPAMQELVEVDTAALPVLWDADFLSRADKDGHVLSEINVSAVAPFPPEAVPKVANAVRDALQTGATAP